MAFRSNDPVLRSPIERELADELYGERRWAWEEFAAIASAIDDLFLELGWLRHG